MFNYRYKNSKVKTYLDDTVLIVDGVKHIHRGFCRKCGSHKHLTTISKTKCDYGVVVHYKLCRECNTQKSVEYRLTPNGKERTGLAVRRSISKYPNKQKARQKLCNKKRRNKISQMECVVCSKKETEAHHYDYRRPLAVLWLCKTHHTIIDKLDKSLGRRATLKDLKSVL
jgi:hypothetical protein